MTVLDRSELEASPLADLHAIADQLGLDGYRRLRKAELIDAILGEPGTAPAVRMRQGAPTRSGAGRRSKPTVLASARRRRGLSTALASGKRRHAATGAEDTQRKN